MRTDEQVVQVHPSNPELQLGDAKQGGIADQTMRVPGDKHMDPRALAKRIAQQMCWCEGRGIPMMGRQGAHPLDQSGGVVPQGRADRDGGLGFSDQVRLLDRRRSHKLCHLTAAQIERAALS